MRRHRQQPIIEKEKFKKLVGKTSFEVEFVKKCGDVVVRNYVVVAPKKTTRAQASHLVNCIDTDKKAFRRLDLRFINYIKVDSVVLDKDALATIDAQTEEVVEISVIKNKTKKSVSKNNSKGSSNSIANALRKWNKNAKYGSGV